MNKEKMALVIENHEFTILKERLLKIGFKKNALKKLLDLNSNNIFLDDAYIIKITDPSNKVVVECIINGKCVDNIRPELILSLQESLQIQMIGLQKEMNEIQSQFYRINPPDPYKD